MNIRLGLILLITSGSLIQFNFVSPQTIPEDVTFNPQQNYVITFINYKEEIVNTNQIQMTLPGSIFKDLNYKINYDLQFANASYTSQLNNFVDSISTPDWTSAINETALNEQKADFGRKDVFTKKNGTAIDARQLETYLANNLPGTLLENDNLFYIFVFNNSRLDSPTQDHWLNATEIDPDSGVPRFYWRLEWDYPENYDVKFPYPAFSEKEELAILDPTAFQWYLTWRAIWNSNALVHDSYFNDLDSLIAGKSSSEQRLITTDTLINWLEDWIFNIFNMRNAPVELGTSFSLQLKVGYDSNEIAQENIDWIVNGDYARDTTNRLLLSQSFQVDIEFLDVNSDPIMKQLIDRSEVSYFDIKGINPPFPDWKFIDGLNFYLDVALNSTVNSQYFDPNAAEIVVQGVILLLDNASFVGNSDIVPWTGGLYTGLGGNFQVVMLWELDRALMEDRITPKAGLSKVLVHEVAHSIGLPHTFTNRFISDFASDVMGYYPGAANYSQLIMKMYQRDSADLTYLEFKNLYENAKISGIIDSQVLNNAFQTFLNFVKFHQSKNYLKAFFELVEGLRILEEEDAGNISTSDPISTLIPPSSGSTSEPSDITTSSLILSKENSNSRTTDKSPLNFPPIIAWAIAIVSLSTLTRSIRKRRVL